MTNLQKWLAVAAALLIVGVLGFCSGYKKGGVSVALQSTRDSLKVVVAEKQAIQKQRDSVGAALAIADKKSGETRTVYVSVKNNVRVQGDSTFDSTGHFIQVLDPRITQRIKSADAHVTSLESELRTAKFAFHVDTVFIAKQEQQTKLNEHIATLVSGSQFSSGFQAGVGYCATVVGNKPCVYAGYGFEVRFP
jgi:hypothetical protein